MTTNLNKRLEELEARIKSAAESPIWIDGKNETVRVDVNGKRGETLTFDSPRAACLWLEGIIDRHPQAAGSYAVDRLWELHRNPDQLRETISAAMGGRVIDRYGLRYSRDNFPGLLFGNLKPGGSADLKLWLLAGGALDYFDTKEFKARWQAQQPNDDDGRMFTACYACFAWERPGATVEDFWRLVVQITRLEAPKMARSESVGHSTAQLWENYHAGR